MPRQLLDSRLRALRARRRSPRRPDRSLAIAKLDKQTWRIACAGAREVRVRYRVYGHELTVRTNHIDGSHAFLHGPATFMYAAAQRDLPVEVDDRATRGLGRRVRRDRRSAATPRTCAPRRSTSCSITRSTSAPVRTHAVPAKVPCPPRDLGERAPGGAFDESAPRARSRRDRRRSCRALRRGAVCRLHVLAAARPTTATAASSIAPRA